ncbi:MAG: peptide chain release factor N(5)-glutamine methyltransferase [Lachnospiraceae bacterium]|nr:peptide chain release factor N(5)-glutamine methyltransferase [Lachnospiraceae bacterium]
MTYRDAYRQGAACLKDAGIEEYDLDARLLLEHTCGITRQDLLIYGDKLLETGAEESFFQAIALRSSRIPLQHITGVQAFMGLDFEVNEDVLIPRQDTETVVETALTVLRPGMEILDLCTGSGCILISLLYYGGEVCGLGTDISPKALLTAARNLERISQKKKLNASLRESDLFDQVTGHFDLILSNPPYIASSVIDTLEPEVRDHEPVLALDGGRDGLAFYRRIVMESRRHLKNDGFLILEIGYDQGMAVRKLFDLAGFEDVTLKQDLAGSDRVVSGRWRSEHV